MSAKSNDGMRSLIKSLEKNTLGIDCTNSRPIILKTNIDGYPLTLSIYLYNALNPPGGRPTGEYKINLNVPGQRVGEVASFDYSLGFTICAGYVADYDVFILWDAYKHRDFKYNSNLQVKISTILGSTYKVFSVQERDTEYGFEKVLCCVSHNLGKTIAERYRIYVSELCDGKLFTKKRVAVRNDDTLDVRLRVKKILEDNPRATIEQIAQMAEIPKSLAAENVKQLKNNDDVFRINLSEEQTKYIKGEISKAVISNPSITFLELCQIIGKSIDFICSFSKDYLVDNKDIQDFIRQFGAI